MAAKKENKTKKEEIHHHGTGGHKFGHHAHPTPHIQKDKMIYKGATKNGKAHGKGKCTWPSGDKYEGEWKENKMHGQGSFRWKEKGSMYEGEYVEGFMEGRGKMTIPGEGVYEGQFLRGQRHGVGTWTSSSGTYQGEYARGRREGLGTLSTGDGCVYEGTWRRGMFHGEGVWRWADGRRFEGVFKTDRPVEGMYHESDGSVARSVRWDLAASRFVPMEAEAGEGAGAGGGGRMSGPGTPRADRAREDEADAGAGADAAVGRGTLMRGIGALVLSTASCGAARGGAGALPPASPRGGRGCFPEAGPDGRWANGSRGPGESGGMRGEREGEQSAWRRGPDTHDAQWGGAAASPLAERLRSASLRLSASFPWSSPPEDGQRGPSGADADGDAEAPDEDGGAGLPAAPPRDARVCGIPGHPNPRVCGWT